MEELIEIFLSTQFILVAAACGILGEVVKKIPNVPNWIIPIVNLVFAVACMLFLMGLDASSVLYGFLAASVATYIYEAVKGTIEKAFPNNNVEEK